MSFEPFQKFLVRAANQYGMKRQVEAAHICQTSRAVLAHVFADTETFEQYVEVGYFREGVLVLKVANGAWAQEVVVKKEKIIREVNERIGQEVVKNLRAELR
jgi:predicted nucleic acid-binding Zn ribbon protein